MVVLAVELVDVLSILTQISIILALGFVLKLFCEKTRMPFIVALILSGTLLASLSILKTEELGVIPDTLRMLALIIVVFANGFYLKLENLLKEGKLIVTLASFGVILTASIVALISHALLGLALLPALFMGAILSGTDPAVIANIIKKMPEKFQTILNMESILNQPLTVILPVIIFDFAIAKTPGLLTLPIYFGKLIVLISVGLIVGLIGFFIGQKVLKIAGVEMEEIAGLVVALCVFALTENLGGSGILAVGITSVLLSSSKAVARETFSEFNRELALLLTIFVFVMFGMQFPLQLLGALEITRFDVIVVIFSVITARLFTIVVVAYKSDLGWKERLKLGLIAPKGLGPAALAPLALTMADTSEFVSMQAALTIMKIVYLTIIISALLSVFVANALKNS